MDDDGEDYFEEEYVEDNNAEVYVRFPPRSMEILS